MIATNSVEGVRSLSFEHAGPVTLVTPASAAGVGPIPGGYSVTLTGIEAIVVRLDPAPRSARARTPRRPLSPIHRLEPRR